MTIAGATSRRRKILKYLAYSAAASVLLLAGMAWYVTTDSFQAMVRRRLVAELETITGGRVELGSYHTSPFQLRVEVRDLTIHGREAPTEIPYAHAERIVAQVKIISILGAEFGFHSLILDHPVIHIIVYPDGTTNQPGPRIAAEKTPVEQLFRLSISRLEVRSGQVLWNDEKIPVDFVVNDVSADMQYSILHQRYICNLLLGKIVTRLQDYRSFAWMLEAHFNLTSKGIEINSLQANSGRSHLQAKGHLTDFRNPQIDGTYDARLDLQEVSGVLRRPEMRRGIIEAQGSASWLLQQFASHGTLAIKDLAWHDQYMDVSNGAMDAAFTLTPQRLTLAKIQGKVLGGSFNGDADIPAWLATVPPAKSLKTREKKEKEKERSGQQRGLVRLRLKDISAGALATAISTPTRPLKLMNLTGSGSGTLELRWEQSLANLEADLNLNVTPPSSPAPGQLPLNAVIHGTYHNAGGSLDIAEFNASTRASQIHASGRLAASGTLKLSVNTSNLGEWQTFLAAFGDQQRIPGILHGQATFNGNVTGKLSNPTVAGNLQMEDFDYLMPATARTVEQLVHWDSVNADVQLSRQLFTARNGALKHGDATVAFSLGTTLDRGRFTDRTAFQVHLDMRGADAAEVLALSGYHYPISGKMDLLADLSGTRPQPQGTGRMHLTDGTFYGEPVQQLDTDLRFNGGEAQFDNIKLAYYDSLVTGVAAYNLTTQTFRFDVRGVNFNLVHLPQSWTSRLQIEGRANFTAKGSGTTEEPIIDATIGFHDLIFDHENMGGFVLEAVTNGPELRLTGHSQFLVGELSLQSDIHLRGDWQSTTDVHFAGLDIDAPLRSYLQGRLTGHSMASGALRLEGPLRHPADLSANGSLSDFSAGVENIKLRNEGPLSFSIANRSLRLNALHLIGGDTDISGTGTVQLDGEHAVDLHAQGKVNLKLIESFDTQISSSGIATLDMTLSGTISRPVTQGRIEVSHGAIADLSLPNAFSDINGSLRFSQNRLEVETLTAHTGGGLVTFGGFATWYNRQLNFDVTLQEQEVRLRYPPGVSSTANADLHFVGSSYASTLSGDITVTKLSVTPGFDFGAYLARSARTPVLPPTNPILNRIRLDVHIVTTPELQMQTAVVRLSGEADLRLRGTAAKPVLLGRADILEGEVYFNGSKYELERGEVAFTSPVTTTPVLDLQATTHVRDYDITLRLNGEPDKLKVTYRSEPPLPEADIITLLAIGRTTTEEAAQLQSGQSSFTQEASSAILNQALNATVSNRAQSLFGVSRIKIDPAGLNTETTVGRGPLVTIEQQVSNSFTITYSTSVEQAAQQIIQVEYNLSHNVSIVALRDQNGVLSFDVRIRHRKK